MQCFQTKVCPWCPNVPCLEYTPVRHHTAVRLRSASPAHRLRETTTITTFPRTLISQALAVWHGVHGTWEADWTKNSSRVIVRSVDRGNKSRSKNDVWSDSGNSFSNETWIVYSGEGGVGGGRGGVEGVGEGMGWKSVLAVTPALQVYKRVSFSNCT